MLNQGSAQSLMVQSLLRQLKRRPTKVVGPFAIREVNLLVGFCCQTAGAEHVNDSASLQCLPIGLVFKRGSQLAGCDVATI